MSVSSVIWLSVSIAHKSGRGFGVIRGIRGQPLFIIADVRVSCRTEGMGIAGGVMLQLADVPELNPIPRAPADVPYDTVGMSS